MSTEKQTPSKIPPQAGTKEDRLAQALRANLRRRKAAARKPVKAAEPDPVETADDTRSDRDDGSAS